MEEALALRNLAFCFGSVGIVVGLMGVSMSGRSAMCGRRLPAGRTRTSTSLVSGGVFDSRVLTKGFFTERVSRWRVECGEKILTHGLAKMIWWVGLMVLSRESLIYCESERLDEVVDDA